MHQFLLIIGRREDRQVLGGPQLFIEITWDDKQNTKYFIENKFHLLFPK
jgi:hypothetical protein